MACVTVEFYGVPRLRAGCARLQVEAATIAEALAAVSFCCPTLADVVDAGGRLNPHYLVCIDGVKFSDSLQQPLLSHEKILLLSADAGG